MAALPLFLHLLPRVLVSAAILAWGANRSGRAAGAFALGASWDVRLLGAAPLFAQALLLPALALGACGWLRDWTWALGAIAGFALLGRARGGDATAGAPAADDGPAPGRVFLVALGGFALGRLVYSLRNPPVDWDSYHYHLPMMATWMQTGRLTAPLHVPPPFGQFFPGGGELLETWMAWTAGRDTLVTWVSVGGLVLLALALRRLALAAGARADLAGAGALLVAAGPGIAQLTMGAKVDHLLVTWFAIALVFAFRHRERGAHGDLGVLLATIGLLPGVKATGPMWAAMALAVAFAPPCPARLPGAFARHRAALAVMLVSGAFWTVRNFAATGNPLFPAEMQLFGRTLPGISMSHEALRHTMQFWVWLDGYAGHLTPRRAFAYFGPGLAALLVGTLAWAATARRADPRARGTGAWLAALAAASFAAWMFTPFSGAYEPAMGPYGLRLNFDNLRLLLPTAVVMMPLMAAGLGRLPWARATAALLGALWLAGLASKLGHVLPGMALAAACTGAAAAARRGRGAPRPARLAAVALAATLLAFAVAFVDPMRERIEAKAWDGFLHQVHSLSWERFADLRAKSEGRPIAIAGAPSWWAAHGRTFAGRAVYVPVGERWDAAQGAFRFLPETRRRPDHALWLENLRRSGARYVVVTALGDSCERVLEESAWCRDDTARFERIDTLACAAAYRVKFAAPAAAGR